MTNERKAILINGIINTLNQELKRKNKELCAKNLHSQQKPLHGADMFFTLAFRTDDQLEKLAAACGL